MTHSSCRAHMLVQRHCPQQIWSQLPESTLVRLVCVLILWHVLSFHSDCMDEHLVVDWFLVFIFFRWRGWCFEFRCISFPDDNRAVGNGKKYAEDVWTLNQTTAREGKNFRKVFCEFCMVHVSSPCGWRDFKTLKLKWLGTLRRSQSWGQKRPLCYKT